MIANMIEDVLGQLQKIISESIERNDRVGYFATLYYKVTARVKEGIKNNEFQSGPRMEKLDVTFANRYLAALEAWKAGGQLTESWKVAFAATTKSSVLVLQQLLLGINAHINLDLGIAAVEVAGQDLQSISQDFNSINTVIAALTNQVINEIDRVSPLLSLFGLHATNYDDALIQFSIDNARDGAWGFAQTLASKKGDEINQCIESRDKVIARLGEALLHQNGLLRVTVWIVHLFEWRSPRKIIRALHEYKKKVIKISRIKPEE
jgi:hypothetical protein